MTFNYNDRVVFNGPYGEVLYGRVLEVWGDDQVFVRYREQGSSAWFARPIRRDRLVHEHDYIELGNRLIDEKESVA